MDKSNLTNLQTQIETVQAQIDHALGERDALKAQYSEALKAVAKQVIEDAVKECGYEIVGPIHDVAKELMEVFPMSPEEVLRGEVVDVDGGEVVTDVEFETMSFYQQAG